ncbi:MAG: cytochrome c [Deltaproteobacteria bacterium]|nr:cytochrome c [Deltaproteobacteria bacterium]
MTGTNPRVPVIATALTALVTLGSVGCDDVRPGAEPCLTVRSGETELEFCRTQLLGHEDVHEVRLGDRGFYRQAGPLTLKAVPVEVLFAGIEVAPDAILDAHGMDGFSAPLHANRVLQGLSSGARAHLAIEEAGEPWPPLGGGRPSAGPFAIVWTGDDEGHVSNEEWPYQLARLSVEEPLTRRYPALMPSSGLPEGHPVRVGLEVFATNCMPCHRFNGAGEAEMGPDLNRPMSPTEYLTEEGLRRIIRDPRSVRAWPASQMPAVTEDQVSEDELSALIAYLEHMAARRARPRPSGPALP